MLYLLPEIALTIQITERLKAVFGDQLGIYHSKYSDAERVEIWQNSYLIIHIVLSWVREVPFFSHFID